MIRGIDIQPAVTIINLSTIRRVSLSGRTLNTKYRLNDVYQRKYEPGRAVARSPGRTLALSASPSEPPSLDLCPYPIAGNAIVAVAPGCASASRRVIEP